jgi:UDP-N-acetylglucosamine 2-epimerase (non-hydrolysing)
MKVLVVASTRPEVIKLGPVLKELRKQGVDHIFATTGQHYDDLLFKRFIQDLRLDEPDYDIRVGSASPAEQTGRAMIGIETLIAKEKPDVVVVEGDTNSVLATALASVKLKYPVAHVEAGLRSLDRTMPEEINRVLTDHSSEVLFAPTEPSALNLVNEGIPPQKIHIVGNTIVDATLANIKLAERSSKIHERFSKDYLLITLHRQENTDDIERMENIFSALFEIEKDIVFPIHPRTSEAIKGTRLESLIKKGNIHVIEPVGYLDFLVLLKNSFAVLTDSGGVQEEAITLNTPCLTLRYNTERPESVWAGGNIVVGTEKNEILEKVALLSDQETYEKMKNALNPYGDGEAGVKIVNILKKNHEEGKLLIESSDTRNIIYSRRIIPVDDRLVGKKVKESGYEIIRIFNDEGERFPAADLILKKGDFIEILNRV